MRARGLCVLPGLGAPPPPPPRGWRRSGSGCRTPGAHLSGCGGPGRARPPDGRTAKRLPRPLLAVLLCVGAAQLWEMLLLQFTLFCFTFSVRNATWGQLPLLKLCASEMSLDPEVKCGRGREGCCALCALCPRCLSPQPSPNSFRDSQGGSRPPAS